MVTRNDLHGKTGYFKILIDGTEIPEQVAKLCQEVTIERTDFGADSCTLEFQDAYFYFLNNPKLFEDLPVYVEIGIVDVPVAPVTFRGYVANVEPNFPDNGIPSISIFCMDESHLLNKVKRSRSWNNMKVSDILRTIANEYGLKANIEETVKVYEKINQSGETDMQFILSLVDSENRNSLGSKEQRKQWLDVDYVVKIRDGTLHFYNRKMNGEPTRELWYNDGNTLIRSFRPSFVTNSNVETDEGDVTGGGAASDIDNSGNPYTNYGKDLTVKDMGSYYYITSKDGQPGYWVLKSSYVSAPSARDDMAPRINPPYSVVNAYSRRDRNSSYFDNQGFLMDYNLIIDDILNNRR